MSTDPSADISNNADQNRFELRLNGDLVGILGYYEFDTAASRQSSAAVSRQSSAAASRQSGTAAGRTPGRFRVVSFMHTVVTEDFGHRGLAGAMVRGALEHARGLGWKVRPVCSFVQRFVAQYPEYRDVVLPVDSAARFAVS